MNDKVKVINSFYNSKGCIAPNILEEIDNDLNILNFILTKTHWNIYGDMLLIASDIGNFTTIDITEEEKKVLEKWIKTNKKKMKF